MERWAADGAGGVGPGGVQCRGGCGGVQCRGGRYRGGDGAGRGDGRGGGMVRGGRGLGVDCAGGIEPWLCWP